MSKHLVLCIVVLVMSGWLAGCGSGLDNHVSNPQAGGKAPPPTALKKAGGQETSNVQQ